MTSTISGVGTENARDLDGLFLPQEELFHISRLVTVGELSACFAHEVFNPLMMIRGHLVFAEEQMGETDPLRLHFDAIDRASKRIEDMARRMLDFTRKRTTQLDCCHVSEVIQDAVRFVHPYVKAHTVDLQLQIDPDLKEMPLDRWQLVQALVNLMQNAVDAMDSCTRRILTVSAQSDGDHVRITVADTGKGIPPSDVSRIFSPFFTTKGERGTGLGLYITQQVVADHRGTIALQTSNRGAAFVVSLPLK